MQKVLFCQKQPKILNKPYQRDIFAEQNFNKNPQNSIHKNNTKKNPTFLKHTEAKIKIKRLLLDKEVHK